MKDSNVTPFPKEKNENKDSSLVSSLSPREIVSELDRYVVGQKQPFLCSFIWGAAGIGTRRHFSL